jgi:uncharacterized protein (TIGR00369 family)
VPDAPSDTPQARAAMVNALQTGGLPAMLGLTWETLEAGRVTGRLVVEARHMAPNGFLHAASVIGLLDTACGYGCGASLPPGAAGFTTLELKSNFLATAQPGDTIACEAKLVHGGHSTQVWDAIATNQTSGKTMALFRCTQMLLHPR